MTRVRRLRALVNALSLSLSLSAAAHAQRAEAPKQPNTAKEPKKKAAEAPPAVPDDQARNYEQPPGTEPEDVALFVPRLVLAVPRYTLKVVFFPIKESIEFLDRHAIVEKVTDFLYNDARTAAVLPTVSVDSTFGPSFGLKAFHTNLAGHDEYGSIEARFGGMYKLASQLHFRAEHFGGTRLWLESVARFESEPGLLFQGIGHGAVAERTNMLLDPRQGAVKTRYSEQRLLSLMRAGYTLGRPGSMLQIGGSLIYNVRDFGVRQRGSGESIERVYDTSQLVGFNDRVSTLETDVNLIFDFRDVAGATASGAYFEMFAGRVPRLNDAYEFWHHGAELTGYFDLYKRTRVLVLRGFVEGVEGKEQEIPFSDLPRLGGPSRLRGYSLDRFRDEKAAVGTLEYHYPIHQYVSGALYADVGRVERTYSDFFHGAWRVGAGGGFIVRSRDHQLFTFDIAYGDAIHFYVTTDPLRAFSRRDTEL